MRQIGARQRTGAASTRRIYQQGIRQPTAIKEPIACADSCKGSKSFIRVAPRTPLTFHCSRRIQNALLIWFLL